jgi:hypothetical protein
MPSLKSLFARLLNRQVSRIVGIMSGMIILFFLATRSPVISDFENAIFLGIFLMGFYLLGSTAIRRKRLLKTKKQSQQ